MDLTTQVGALVGTSVLLYIAMKPSHADLVEEFADPTKLRGCQRYSPYHRKRLRSLSSSMSSSSSACGGASDCSVSSDISVDSTNSSTSSDS